MTNTPAAPTTPTPQQWRERILEVLHDYECEEEPRPHAYWEHVFDVEPQHHPNRIDGLVELVTASQAEARASVPLDVREALHESLSAMVSVSEAPANEFARGLKQARLEHAISVARKALGLTTTDEGGRPE